MRAKRSAIVIIYYYILYIVWIESQLETGRVSCARKIPITPGHQRRRHAMLMKNVNVRSEAESPIHCT